MTARILLLALLAVGAIAAVVTWRMLDSYTRQMLEDVRRAIGGE